MNTGAFGENFPYSNFHDLNMDWIIKIAKDFLDQYTNIQNTITEGLEELDSKAQELEDLLQQWYDTHSADIAGQLAEALNDLNTWYTTHQGYLEQYVSDSISAFNTAADLKAAQTIASIPADYTELSNEVSDLEDEIFEPDYSCPVKAIPDIIQRQGAGNTSTSYIRITSATSGYDSYYKVVEEATTIWFEETVSPYVSICIGEDYTETTTPSETEIRLYCSNSVRYRKSENNLPTRQNPAIIPAGGVFVVTVTAGGNDLVYGATTPTRAVKKEFADSVLVKAEVYDVSNYVKVSEIQDAVYQLGAGSSSTSYIVIADVASRYDSYYKIVEEDTPIWFEETVSPYVSLCIGENYTKTTTPSEDEIRLYCSNSVRYRKTEDNLPTRQNPAIIPAGGVFVVTVTAGGNDLVYGVGTTAHISDEFIRELEEKTNIINAVKVNIQDEDITLTGTNYKVNFHKRSTTQGYQWVINNVSSPTGNNVIPANTDIIGVLAYVGEDNFIGGMHGNESVTDFSLWSEGNEITRTGTYKNVRIWMASHLYSVNNPTVNAVDRFVEMNFNEHGWTCRVTFKIITAGTIASSYSSGLFAFGRTDTNMAVCNLGEIDLTSTSRQYNSTEFKQITINITNNMTITIKSNTGVKGFVTYRESTDSYKVYFAGQTNQVVSSGDYITGECEYIF